MPLYRRKEWVCKMKYRQITGDEALRLCRNGTAVLAARYVEGMTFRQAAELTLFLAPEEPGQAMEAPEPCATSHKAPPKAKKPGCEPLDIDVRKVAEMKADGMKVKDMAEAFGTEPTRMSRWLYKHKAEVEEAVQQLEGAREVAKACCGKEGQA